MELPAKSITASDILRRHEEKIHWLRNVDAEFQEQWTSYMEIIEALQSPGLDDSSQIELGRLRASLEAEILESLLEHPGS